MGGGRAAVDGGSGTDLLVINASDYHLTAANTAEFGRLAAYLAGDTSQHFVSEIFQIGIVNVETVSVRLGGVLTSLATIVPGPSATDDRYDGTDDAVLRVDAAHGLLANDSALAGGLRVQAGTYGTALGGTVTISADGSFDYVALAGTNATDSFGYTVFDALGRSVTASVSLDITPGTPTINISFEEIDTGNGGGWFGYGATLVTQGFNISVTPGMFENVISFFATDGMNTLISQNYAVEGYMSISRQDGSPFHFRSIDLQGAYIPTGDNTLEAYSNGVLVHSEPLTWTGGWQTFAPNWTAIDEVRIVLHSYDTVYVDHIILA